MSAADTVKILYKQMKQLEAGSTHFVMNEVFKDEEACAVISVYDGEKPAHMVLDELYEWAEENGNKELIDKIDSLQDDLSFMKED